MHIVALGYPKSPTYGEKRAAKEFYESMAFLIPCPVCREHYSTNLKKYPLTPHLDTRDDLFRWTVMIHNEVNKVTGKAIVPEAEAIYYYRRIGARGKSPLINQDTLDELDYRSMIKGALLGGGLVLGAGVILWLISSSEKSLST
jgi:hypothetical protein